MLLLNKLCNLHFRGSEILHSYTLKKTLCIVFTYIAFCRVVAVRDVEIQWFTNN